MSEIRLLQIKLNIINTIYYVFNYIYYNWGLRRIYIEYHSNISPLFFGLLMIPFLLFAILVNSDKRFEKLMTNDNIILNLITIADIISSILLYLFLFSIVSLFLKKV